MCVKHEFELRCDRMPRPPEYGVGIENINYFAAVQYKQYSVISLHIERGMLNGACQESESEDFRLRL